MIKFFNRNRHNLLSESKTKKYIKYAIGEIVLIVLGILIALQLNLWSEKRKDRSLARQVLLNLKYDLQKDTTDLNNLLQIKQGQLSNCQWMLDVFTNPDKEISDSTQFIENMRKPFYFYVDNPHKTAFELAKSSGDLFKIMNDTLIKKISVYFSNNDATQFLAANKKFSTEYMSDIYMQNHRLNFHDFQKFKIDFLQDFKMENYYLMMMEQLGVSIDVINKKTTNAVNLMEDIDNEIF